MNRRLPPWKIFKKALSLVWEKRDFVMRISWPLVVVTVLLIIVTNGIVRSVTPELSPSFNASEFAQFYWVTNGLLIAHNAVQGFFMAILAVYWHRNILLHETQAPNVPLRFDGVIWRYIFYGVALGLMTIGLSLVTAVPFFITNNGSKILVVLLIVPLAVVMWTALFRCSLVLPATAIGYSGFGLGQAWSITRGNTWPIMFLLLLIFAASVSIGFVFGFIKAIFAKLFAASIFWIGLIGNFAINWFLALLCLSVLSLTYAYLTHEPQQKVASIES